MPFGIIFICSIINLICRCIIFNKRDIKWVWAIIPGANKYKIGKLVKSKKLGIINAIIHPLLTLCFLFCFGYELWIIQNYAVYATVPKDGSSSAIQVRVPQNVANIAIWSKYILIGLVVITVIVWSMMMWKFTMQHKKNPWWIILWVIIPVIPYIYFATISDVVAIDGKRYITKRIEVTANDKRDKKST